MNRYTNWSREETESQFLTEYPFWHYVIYSFSLKHTCHIPLLKYKLSQFIFLATKVSTSEKAMAPHSSTLAWRIPWTEEPGRLQSMGSLRVEYDWATFLSFFTFHFHALEKEMATHSSVLDWRIPGMGEPCGLPSMGSHRVGHDWSNLAAAAAPPNGRQTGDWCPLRQRGRRW